MDAKDVTAVRRFFETYFVPNLVRAPDGADAGLITGYYEAMLRGSRKRGGAYQTPLYKVPDDLITVDLASVYPSLKGMRLRGERYARWEPIRDNSELKVNHRDAEAQRYG